MNGEQWFAIALCLVALAWLAWSLCRAAADGDRALAGPLDEDAETFDTSAVEPIGDVAMPLSESPAAVRIRELIFANDVERWLAAREEEAS